MKKEPFNAQRELRKAQEAKQKGYGALTIPVDRYILLLEGYVSPMREILKAIAAEESEGADAES